MCGREPYNTFLVPYESCRTNEVDAFLMTLSRPYRWFVQVVNLPEEITGFTLPTFFTGIEESE